MEVDGLIWSYWKFTKFVQVGGSVSGYVEALRLPSNMIVEASVDGSNGSFHFQQPWSFPHPLPAASMEASTYFHLLPSTSMEASICCHGSFCRSLRGNWHLFVSPTSTKTKHSVHDPTWATTFSKNYYIIRLLKISVFKTGVFGCASDNSRYRTLQKLRIGVGRWLTVGMPGILIVSAIWCSPSVNCSNNSSAVYIDWCRIGCYYR